MKQQSKDYKVVEFDFLLQSIFEVAERYAGHTNQNITTNRQNKQQKYISLTTIDKKVINSIEKLIPTGDNIIFNMSISVTAYTWIFKSIHV